MVSSLPLIIGLKEAQSLDFLDLPAQITSRLSLSSLDIKVPQSLIITPEAFSAFIRENNTHTKISYTLKSCDYHDPHDLNRVSLRLNQIISESPIPAFLFDAIRKGYKQHLQNQYFTLLKDPTSVKDPKAVICSQGESSLCLAIRQYWADFFTPEQIRLQILNHSFFLKVDSFVVSEYVKADYTGLIDTSAFSENKHLLDLAYVRGSAFLLGPESVLPSAYSINRETGQVLSARPCLQYRQFLCSSSGQLVSKVIPRSQQSPVFSKTILQIIVNSARKIHHHFTSPQRIVFQIRKNDFIVIMVKEKEKDISSSKPQFSSLVRSLTLLGSGTPASPGFVSGPYRKITPRSNLNQVNYGDIVVINQFKTQYAPLLKKAACLVSIQGSPLSHLSIISRELGIPAVVNCHFSLNNLCNGDIITVDAVNGKIYQGGQVTSSPLTPAIKPKPENQVNQFTATKIFLTYDPSHQYDTLSAHGFYLTALSVQKSAPLTAPANLINLSRSLQSALSDAGDRPVIYCLETQFFAALGSQTHDPQTHYLDPSEIKAVERALKTIGRTGIILALPNIKFPDELVEAKKILAGNDWHRTLAQKLYLIINTPAAVLDIERFIQKGIDGLIINSDMLIPLTLGINPESFELAPRLKLEQETVKTLFSYLLTVTQEYGLPVFLSGYCLNHTGIYLNNLVKSGLTGVITSPALYPIIKQRLQFSESRLFK